MSLKKIVRKGKHKKGDENGEDNKRLVPEKIARPTRTGIQIAIAGYIVSWFSEHIDHLTRDEAMTYTGLTAMAVNYVWVAIEDYLEAGILRRVPPKDVPAIDTNTDDEPTEPTAPAV